MRATGFAAIMLVAVSAGMAHAERGDPDWAWDWSRQIEALARSLAGERAADREIIRPPANIDPKMAVGPRYDQGRMRTIVPPGAGRR
jgi:hypothetical protein